MSLRKGREMRNLRRMSRCVSRWGPDMFGRFAHVASQSCTNGHRRGQLGLGAAYGVDSDVVQQFGVDQRNASCAAHANGAATGVTPWGEGQGEARHHFLTTGHPWL